MNALRVGFGAALAILLLCGLGLSITYKDLFFKAFELSSDTVFFGNATHPRIYSTRGPTPPSPSPPAVALAPTLPPTAAVVNTTSGAVVVVATQTTNSPPSSSPTSPPTIDAGCVSPWTWRKGHRPSVEEGNEILIDLIKKNCSISLYRLGGTESHALQDWYQHKTVYSPRNVWMESGVFPDDEKITRQFVILTEAAVRTATICVDMHPLKWPTVSYLCSALAPDSIRITWHSLVSFWGGDRQGDQGDIGWGLADPWLNYFANKIVLVVSSFSITGPKQYHRKDSKLPRFKELKWIKPPVAFAMNYPPGYENKTWLDALQDLKDKITAAGDFDYALISCGAFGSPLIQHIQALGKSAMYLGGSLQAVFGIRGTRWNSIIDEHIKRVPGDASWWVPCDPKERPPNCERMENCAYM